MPCHEQVRVAAGECLPFAVEQDEGIPCILGWIVALAPNEVGVVVVLDQVVVGVGREGQRTEPKRVHHWQFEQAQVWRHRPQVGNVELDEIVAEQAVGASSELVELFEAMR